MNKNFPLIYSDHEYVEMWAELERHDDAITVMSDPYVIVRPEGRWDKPGALDSSAQRARRRTRTMQWLFAFAVRPVTADRESFS